MTESATDSGDRGSISIELSDFNVGDGNHQTLENGDIVKWIPLAEAGEEFLHGGRKFDITPELIDQGIKNFEDAGKAPLPITKGHLNNPGAPAEGWIEDIRKGSPPEMHLEDSARPWGKVRILKNMWDSIQRGEFKFFSLEFYPKDVDQKGTAIGFKFDGGAILNKPFFPIRVDQARPGGACFRLSRFTGGTSRKEMSMPTPEELAAAEAAKKKTVIVEGDKVTLSREQYTELAKVREENASLLGQLEESKAKNQSNETRLMTLERTTGADKIRAAIKTLQRDHRIVVPLGEYAIETSDSECFEWLATAPMGVTTVEGLQKLARDQEATAHLPRIPGGKEVGGGTDRVPPADLTTEAGRKEAVRRHALQLKRDFSKEELGVQLARRGQSLEQFAAADLAAEHPDHRKELHALAK